MLVQLRHTAANLTRQASFANGPVPAWPPKCLELQASFRNQRAVWERSSFAKVTSKTSIKYSSALPFFGLGVDENQGGTPAFLTGAKDPLAADLGRSKDAT